MKRKMILTILALLLVVAAWMGRMVWVAAGQQPRGLRLERCERSPQWRNGQFVNRHDTPMMTGESGLWQNLYNYFFYKVENLVPEHDVPTAKSSLKDLKPTDEVVVWLGHSSLFVQTGGKRLLFDPVLTTRLPVQLFMKPFRGADVYTPDDIPDIDYLVITHDHWDHLDYETVRELRPRVRNVVCALGIGQHFEYWGYDISRIHDLDWGDSLSLASGMTLRCLPARHFSGRLLGRNKTLWASYLIDGPRRIFVSGDGGYDDRFRDISTRYPGIDLTVMENGQYDPNWRLIHTMPSELPKAVSDLGARRLLTYHNSKYGLAKHSWTAPLDSILHNSKGQPWTLLTPRIGDRIDLTQQQTFRKWW